jgi:hypothetical protein
VVISSWWVRLGTHRGSRRWPHLWVDTFGHFKAHHVRGRHPDLDLLSDLVKGSAPTSQSISDLRLSSGKDHRTIPETESTRASMTPAVEILSGPFEPADLGVADVTSERLRSWP